MATSKEDREFQLSVKDESTWEPLFAYLCQCSVEGFSGELGERTKRMGFLRDQARRALFATTVQTITRFDGFVEAVIGGAVTAWNTR